MKIDSKLIGMTLQGIVKYQLSTVRKERTFTVLDTQKEKGKVYLVVKNKPDDKLKVLPLSEIDDCKIIPDATGKGKRLV